MPLNGEPKYSLPGKDSSPSNQPPERLKHPAKCSTSKSILKPTSVAVGISLAVVAVVTVQVILTIQTLRLVGDTAHPHLKLLGRERRHVFTEFLRDGLDLVVGGKVGAEEIADFGVLL